ncbi:MAG: hypothetical protein JSR17_08350, partial [Proteobacteria bacterium]|nr:hypothetical protein [Pseudomonadota bacterium]
MPNPPIIHTQFKVSSIQEYNQNFIHRMDNLLKDYKQLYGQVSDDQKMQISEIGLNLARIAMQIEKTKAYSSHQEKINLQEVIQNWNKVNAQQAIPPQMQMQLQTIVGFDAVFDRVIKDANQKYGTIAQSSEFKDIVQAMSGSGKYPNIENDLQLSLGDFIKANFPYPAIEGNRNQFIIDAVKEYASIHKEEENNPIMMLIKQVETINNIRMMRDKFCEAKENFDTNPEVHQVTLENTPHMIEQLIKELDQCYPHKGQEYKQCLESLNKELILSPSLEAKLKEVQLKDEQIG